MTSQAPSISPDMTMEHILEQIPGAQRALFQRYHVGGCSSCGFQPTDTLNQVCKDRNLLDVNEVVDTILRAHEVDQKMTLDPKEAHERLMEGSLRLIDVRSQDEWNLVNIKGAELLDYNDSEKYMQLPKETVFAFLCKNGDRSKDVASYFAGHGFAQVYAVGGGLDGWRAHVDPDLADYDLE